MGTLIQKIPSQFPKLRPATRPRQPLGEPLESRLAFDWAKYHCVQLQSPEEVINQGLDLWLASRVEALRSPNGDPLPGHEWKTYMPPSTRFK
jgi:hypothetical protein